MKLPRRQFLQFGAGAAALPPISRFAWAQTFPSRRITMVVPFPPGALTDRIARILAEGMRTSLSQPIVIENVGGADGSIGTGRVAHAASDGYTLVLGAWNTHVTNAAIYALGYDVVRDFEPIALLPDAPMVLIVKKAMPTKNLTEFIAWLRTHPDEASMGTGGPGSPTDMHSERDAHRLPQIFIDFREWKEWRISGYDPAMWSKILSEPIELDNGSALETLYDARKFLSDIATDTAQHEKWRRVAIKILNAARTGPRGSHRDCYGRA